jgi:CarD family transcriptional regulator
MFKVGDKVVHPAHGAGIIAAVEKKDVLDDFNRYYIIDLAAQDMKLMVPVRTAEEIGLRRVATKKGSREILGIVSSEPEELPDDFKKRQAVIHERLREGSAESLATVVRDMAHRSHSKMYSPTEARLYEQARTMLGGELALALGMDVSKALDRIDKLVAEEPAEA